MVTWQYKNHSMVRHTAFATLVRPANPTVYNGGGHNGVDFKDAIGTPVMASKERRGVET